MRKKIIGFPVVFFIFMTLVIPSYAADNNSSNVITGLQINYEEDKGHRDRSKQEIIDELVNEGVDYQDAEFYAKLDILAASLEKNDIKLNFDEIEAYPHEYVSFNMFEIRQKALELDKRAIKSLAEHSTVLAVGNKDLKKVLDSEASAKTLRNSEGGKTTVKYPDGSSITKISETVLLEADDGYTTDTNWPGPWDGHGGGKDMYHQKNHNSTGKFYDTNDVKYEGGIYWAKVGDVLTYQLKNNGSTNKNNWSVHFIADDGAASSSGFIDVPSVEKSNHKGSSGVGDYVIQGFTDATFKISASVGGSISFAGAALSFSISAGDMWHAYAINEVFGYGVSLAWEAYYY